MAFFCCFRQGVAGTSRDLGRDVPDLEELYARKVWADFFRAARVQNETAPEKFLNRYEKRFEKREKGSKKRSETRLKIF